MNEEHTSSEVSDTPPEDTTNDDVIVAGYSANIEDGRGRSVVPAQRTKDLYQSIQNHFKSEPALPKHIVELHQFKEDIQNARVRSPMQLSKDIGIQSSLSGNKSLDKVPMLVIVDASCLSDPSSTELVIDKKMSPRDVTNHNYLSKHRDDPSTSKSCDYDYSEQEHASRDEIQIDEMNLQSDSKYTINDEASVDSIDENKSIVTSYLQNRNTIDSMEESSESLETGNLLECHELSKSSLDDEPREKRHWTVESSYGLSEKTHPDLKEALEFIHSEKKLLSAAEIGHVELLKNIIKQGKTNLHKRDQLGRNALHLAVCSENEEAVELLLKAGVNPNVKDNVGSTPLSLSLLRRPSLKLAFLLFKYGAIISLTRSNPADLGFFLVFVSMCKPTKEEVQIMELLISKGAKVNDPFAPGGRQALHLAAMSNNFALIEVLVNLGADLFAQNHRAQTPKDVAIAFNCKDAEQCLSEKEISRLF